MQYSYKINTKEEIDIQQDNEQKQQDIIDSQEQQMNQEQQNQQIQEQNQQSEILQNIQEQKQEKQEQLTQEDLIIEKQEEQNNQIEQQQDTEEKIKANQNEEKQQDKQEQNEQDTVSLQITVEETFMEQKQQQQQTTKQCMKQINKPIVQYLYNNNTYMQKQQNIRQEEKLTETIKNMNQSQTDILQMLNANDRIIYQQYLSEIRRLENILKQKLLFNQLIKQLNKKAQQQKYKQTQPLDQQLQEKYKYLNDIQDFTRQYLKKNWFKIRLVKSDIKAIENTQILIDCKNKKTMIQKIVKKLITKYNHIFIIDKNRNMQYLIKNDQEILSLDFNTTFILKYGPNLITVINNEYFMPELQLIQVIVY